MNKTGTGNGRKKSVVWNHFEKIMVEKGVTKAMCNYCQKSYHAKSKSCGTSNLLAVRVLFFFFLHLNFI